MTLKTQPTPSISTLGMSIPHHSLGFMGLGWLRVGVRLALRPRRAGPAGNAPASGAAFSQEVIYRAVAAILEPFGAHSI